MRRRVLLVPTLLLLGGCSTTRQAHLPGELDAAWKEGRELTIVEKGEPVRVHLKSGETVRGEVIEVDLHRLVVGRPSNYGFQELTFMAVEIERIEVARSTGLARFGGGVVTGAVLACIVLGIAIGLSGGIGIPGGS